VSSFQLQVEYGQLLIQRLLECTIRQIKKSNFEF
jgi:hypothetical protein